MIADKGVKAITRACEILDLLRDHSEGLMLSDLAQQAELPKATVHRILQPLIQHQLVREHPSIQGYYSLGVGVLSFSKSFMEGFDLIREVHPSLTKLNEETSETIHLAIFDSSRRWAVYLLKIDSPHPVRMVSRVGQVVPVHCTSLGKAMLSCLTRPQLEEIFEGYEFQRFTENTITTVERLYAELEETAKRGYALDMQEHEAGVICIGAPIMDRHGRPLAAISLSAPSTRIPEDHLLKTIDKVCSTAQSINSVFADLSLTEIS